MWFKVDLKKAELLDRMDVADEARRFFYFTKIQFYKLSIFIIFAFLKKVALVLFYCIEKQLIK